MKEWGKQDGETGKRYLGRSDINTLSQRKGEESLVLMLKALESDGWTAIHRLWHSEPINNLGSQKALSSGGISYGKSTRSIFLLCSDSTPEARSGPGREHLCSSRWLSSMTWSYIRDLLPCGCLDLLNSRHVCFSIQHTGTRLSRR